ncbi:MAG: hypothetical protein QOE08_668 [Thermoleophilaceae bacterium]|nr:hypothetical protein [Thermoleophilaceae bacterium]
MRVSAPVPLVTCVHTRGAVAGLRALGVAGPGPIAVGPGWTAAGLWSRYTRRRVAGADTIEAPVDFVRRVGEAASGFPEVVIYPGQEESLDALLAHEKLLPAHARLPYPPGAGADLRNKASLARLAEAAGFNPPRTLYDGPAGGLAAAGLTPPFVVKPLMKASGFGPAAVIETAGDLEHAIQGLPAGEPLLAQEHLVGDLVAVSLVTGPGGSTVARFQQRALRTWPPDAGPSSVAVSVAPDEELISRSAALLGDAGYWGLAELQFLVTESGMRGPIDVNPRFFGSLPLALAAGVNLPAAWHAVATGQPAPTPAGYREGVTYRWFEAELLAAIHGSPRVLLGRPRRPRVGAMWSAADPVPGVLLGGRALAEWLARRVRRGNAA